MPEEIVYILVMALICVVIFIVVIVIPMFNAHFWRDVCLVGVEVLWGVLGSEQSLLGAVTKTGAVNACYGL